MASDGAQSKLLDTKCEFANLDELLAATNPQSGNYVIQLYGNIFIHQKPGTNANQAKVSAYQTDSKGRLYFIADVHTSPFISQLSVSADGRYFGFITIEDGLTSGYVYYLDVLAREMDIAYSWSYTYCPNPVLMFSPNSQFAIFSPGANKVYVQPLYSQEPEVVFVAPTNDTKCSQMSANTISMVLGYDYLVWLQTTGELVVIDLVGGYSPEEWPNTGINLAPTFASCTFINDYLVYIQHMDEQSTAAISLLQINPITMTVSIINHFEFPEMGAIQCIPNQDGKSITLHNYYNHRETRMSVLLPEITTSFT